ncbi:MAG: phosphate ABC transporter substrate-binding protein [Candidatus Goldiibacteriota bacterium HGW-Goldbacteria-1]|jgi:phosphate transport system substrate-binding protein|nr:MAG: phosphate ABC transporter substrate-binding protein [Candidatus Goldiibacteriota bacterium HGW-Goldbacteria-1]
MKKFFKMAVVLSVMALAAGSAFAWDWPWAKKSENKISLTGSTTVLPIAQKAAEEFMKANPSVEVSVKGGGSGVGIAAIIDGSADIGNASRAIKAKEIINAKSKGVNAFGTEVAKDGIAMVVHKSNPVDAITINQLRDIFSGKITKWSQLGIGSGKIVAVSRDTTSGTYEVFSELVLRGAKLRDDSIMTVSNREVAENVKNTEGAIGYLGLAFLSDDMKVLKVEGVMATEANVINGTYKVARPLFMYTNGDPSGLVKQYIDYVLSPAGQKIVKEVGYVPVK